MRSRYVVCYSRHYTCSHSTKSLFHLSVCPVWGLPTPLHSCTWSLPFCWPVENGSGVKRPPSKSHKPSEWLKSGNGGDRPPAFIAYLADLWIQNGFHRVSVTVRVGSDGQIRASPRLLRDETIGMWYQQQQKYSGTNPQSNQYSLPPHPPSTTHTRTRDEWSHLQQNWKSEFCHLVKLVSVSFSRCMHCWCFDLDLVSE